jgi:hypothetical protein
MQIRCPFVCVPSMRDAMPEAVIASRAAREVQPKRSAPIISRTTENVSRVLRH